MRQSLPASRPRGPKSVQNKWQLEFKTICFETQETVLGDRILHTTTAEGRNCHGQFDPLPVSGSTVSNTELSESFGPHRVPGRELSEFRSVYYLCAKANSPSFFFPELTEFAPKLSEFSSPKQYSRSSIPPVSHKLQNPKEAPDTITSHDVLNQEWPRQTKPKEGQFVNFSQGHSGTKVQCESCLFS